MQDIMDVFLQQGALLAGEGDSLWLGVGDRGEDYKTAEGSAAFFLVKDFFDLEHSRKFYPRQVLEIKKSDFLRELKKYGKEQGWTSSYVFYDEATKSDFQEPLKKDFQRDFDKIQQAIERGELEKAVPVVWERFFYDFDGHGVWRLLVRLLENSHENLIPYGHWQLVKKKSEGMLGATPEVLFQSQDEKTFQTMALAGTRLDDEEEEIPFEQDPKELEEHRYVVSFLKERLKMLAERVEIGQTGVLPLSGLRHLCTPMEFSFLEEKRDAWSLIEYLINHLHPTPALGVSSKKWDWQWLKKLSHQRERREFGAPFGFYDGREKMKVVVSIRNIMWQGSQGVLGSGCGIVKGSQMNKEWSELFGKRRSVKRLFSII